MKKYLLILVALMISFLIIGCGDDDDFIGDNGSSSSSSGSGSSSSGGGAAECGNTVVEGAEMCDGNTSDCSEISSEFVAGVAACLSDCSGFDTATCKKEGDPIGDPECGNSVTDEGEECDSSVENCADLSSGDYESGLAPCKDDCTGYDITECVESSGGSSSGGSSSSSSGGSSGGGTGDCWDDSLPYEADGDEDGDGIPNNVECVDDYDADGMPNYLDPDSDGDGILDEDEAGEDPANPANSDKDEIPDFLDKDSDNDGLRDKDEITKGTNPTEKDSDGDGSDDYAEIVYGSDPTDPGSKIPNGIFYVVLPFSAPEDVYRTLEFTTFIERVDVAIMIDLSGSMDEEQANLKTGIKDVIIDGVRAQVADSAFSIVHYMDWDEDHTKIFGIDTLVTLDADAVKTAVDNTPDTYGGTEPHEEVLYQAATGAGLKARLTQTMGIGFEVNIPAADCTGQEGDIGGLCIRDMAMPIFIMITDEAFEPVGVGPMPTYSWDTAPQYEMGHYKEQAVEAMNSINAKFIGVMSSSSPEEDFQFISENTGSLNSSGEPFNFSINADGTGMSQAIADTIASFVTAIQMDVTTKADSDENCEGTSAADFMDRSVPNSADPASGISGQDDTTFFKVDPGTLVSFDVYFYNGFCKNKTNEPLMFNADIRVLGEGAYLSSKEVQIIVPPSDNM